MLKFVRKIRVNKTKNNPIKLISITLLIGVFSPGCHSESKTLSKNEPLGFFCVLISCFDAIVMIVSATKRDTGNRKGVDL